MSGKSPVTDSGQSTGSGGQPQHNALPAFQQRQQADINSLVKAVMDAHERHQEALRNGTSFTASPQLSPHHGSGSTHQAPLSPSSTAGGLDSKSEVDMRSGSGSVQDGGLPANSTGVVNSSTVNKSQGDTSDTPIMSGDSGGRVSIDYNMTDPIVDLGKAATELYLALGGSDHKNQATTLLLALEGTLELIRDSAHLLKSMHLIPMADVIKHAEKFVHLMADAKELFVSAASVSTPGGRSELLTPPYGAPLSPSAMSPVRRENTGIGSSSAAERKTLTLGNPTPPAARGPMVMAEDELYDVTLLLRGSGPRSPGAPGPVSPGGTSGTGRDPEVDDEMLALKSRIQSLSLQKKSLESHVERLEIQLKKQADAVSKETHAMREQHLEMEKDLAWMATQVEKGLWLPTYSGSPKHRSSPDKNATAPPHHIDRDAAPKSPLDAAQEGGGAGSDVGNSPNQDDRSYSVSPQRQLLIAPNDVASFRANKLDVLYADTYRGRGMEMVWNVVECVYKREFAATAPSSSPTAAAGDGNVSPHSAGAAANMVGKIGTPNDKPLPNSSNYATFVAAYRRKIGDLLEDQAKFNAQMVETTPLRSDYVANCLSNRLKPNSGVVKLLTTITQDDSVEVLNLHSNYIGDGGLVPIIPLLTRLYRLKTLDLSDNGLKNGAIHQLTTALQRHPTVQHVNVSNNPITRSGGKDLLTLASSCNNVVEINCSGTQIETILQERILHRTQLNLDTTKH